MTAYAFTITAKKTKYTVTCYGTGTTVTSIGLDGPDGPVDLESEQALALFSGTRPIRLVRFLAELNRLANEGMLSDNETTETTLRKANRIRNLVDCIDPDEPASPVFLALASVADAKAREAAVQHPNWPWPEQFADASPAQVAGAAAAAPHVLRQIADREHDSDGHGDSHVWANLLRNPNTPNDVLEQAADFASGTHGTTHGAARSALDRSCVYAERGTNPNHLWLIASHGRTSKVWFNPHFPPGAAAITARITDLDANDPYQGRMLSELYEAIANRPDCTPELAAQVRFVANATQPGQHQLY